MNTILNAMKQMDNITTTENGGVTYKSTMSGLMDLFAMGAAYRKRSEDDVIFLFDKAFKEDETYALKCLFYLFSLCCTIHTNKACTTLPKHGSIIEPDQCFLI